jgi:hypothetical protein
VKILVRLAFVLLILLSAVGQLQALRRDNPDVGDVASLRAPLAALGLRTTAPDQDGVINATAPDCGVPVRIGTIAAPGIEPSQAALFSGPGVRTRYIYLGLVIERPAAAWRVYVRWLQGGLAALVGLRSKNAPVYMVAAAIPDACPHLASVDWGTLSPWK